MTDLFNPAPGRDPGQGYTPPTGLRRSGARLLQRMDSRQPGGRFPALDGFRAVAAIGVLVYHVAGYAGLTNGAGLLARFLHNLGNFGVATFFLLSGFLLYRPFVGAWFAGREAPDPFVFLRRRVVRILPAYWLALSAFLLLGLNLARRPGADHFFTLFSLTQIYRKGYPFSGLAVAWTLCIEMAFYLMLPLIAVAIRAIAPRARSLRARLEVQLVGLGMLVAVTWLFRWFVAGPAQYDAERYPFATFHLWLPNYFDWFALGMGFAVAVAWRDAGRSIPARLERLADNGWLCWLIAAGCYGTLMLARTSHATATGGIARETTVLMFVRFTLNGAAAFFFLLPGILATNNRHRIVRTLGSYVPAFLGTVSYGIYLWHKVWIDRLKVGHELPGRRIGFWVLLVEVLVLSVVTAALSYFFVEKPLLRFKDSKRRARSAPADTGAGENPRATVP